MPTFLLGERPAPAPLPAPYLRPVIWAPVAALAVIAVLLIAFVAFDLGSDSGSGESASPTTGDVRSDPPSPSPPPTGLLTPSPTEPTGPAAEYVKVGKGDCVDLRGTPDVNLAMWEPWVENRLRRVDCAAEDAYMKVTGVRWTPGVDCPAGAAESEFIKSTGFLEDVAVCVRRQFSGWGSASPGSGRRTSRRTAGPSCWRSPGAASRR